MRVNNFSLIGIACLSCALMFANNRATADPCGMVPPIYTGPGSPITRVGLQQTYVFFDQGIESFVIRPGFTGKVDNFGMLIPFPTPPAIRKVPDNVFDQIKNAIDPPEVVVDLRPRRFDRGAGIGGGGGGVRNMAKMVENDEDRLEVLNEEAVGMYEVAVLSAGSAKALKKWMDQNKYQYPDGMDGVTNDYVKQGWCFVAVKTRVGQKSTAQPRPGQRQVNPAMPAGAVFNGAVQALGFRFRTKKLVVPMRLSAFNSGEMRNIVYLLTRGGRKVRSIPEEYVVRQLSGKDLVKHLTSPVPLRIIGGTRKDIPRQRLDQIKAQRKPGQYNGVAKALFASDIHAVELYGKSEDDLTLAHEETEKELFRIGEHFGLRGPEIDAQVANITNDEAEAIAESTFRSMRNMTLTVVDGDFPRDVVAKENLTFDRFKMARTKNSARFYDAKIHGPAPSKPGRLFSAALSPRELNEFLPSRVAVTFNPAFAALGMLGAVFGILGLFCVARPVAYVFRKQPTKTN